MPSNIEIVGVDVVLTGVMIRETILRSYINEIKDDYDYILVDCPHPGDAHFQCALAAADSVLQS